MATDETTTCPWCGAALSDTATARCGDCGAVLRPDGAEPEMLGVTIAPRDHHLPPGVRAAQTVEPEIESLMRMTDEAAEHEALAPPAPEVRRAMLEVGLEEPGSLASPWQPGAAAAAVEVPLSTVEIPLTIGEAMQGDHVRFPAPASFITEEQLALGPTVASRGTCIRIGMSTPSTTDDGWWLAVVFAHDDDGLVAAEAVAPAAGPPAESPLHVMGPVFAGSLSGLIAEEHGRQMLRLALPDADPDRPWSRPLLVRLALRWEPLRAETLGRDALARQVLLAFRHAIEAAGHAS